MITFEERLDQHITDPDYEGNPQREYRCGNCNHIDSDHDDQDKGECFVADCSCKGIV